METTIIQFDDCRFEVLYEGDLFIGLGATHIGSTPVRSGRLPLRPYTQTFSGLELSELRLDEIIEKPDAVRLRLRALFRPLEVKLRRDHSFDPVHETGDWNESRAAGTGRLDLILRKASDCFDGAEFQGFSYSYEYSSRDTPLFYLLDKASWELDGDIAGGTVISQSSCSSPVVTFAPETAWSTEGVLHWDDAASSANPVMTHNLPRWASHQAFDFQFKDDKTLIGVWEHAELIRSVLKREADKPELKTFDKYLFDQTTEYSTPAKSILLNTQSKTVTVQKNLWTRVLDQVHDRARAEFGLREEPLVSKLCHDYWDNFSIKDYHKDFLPAAVELGFEALFVDNLNKSAMTERCPHPDFHRNMCCPHEYEPAARLGGSEHLKTFVDECRQHDITPFAWTNNNQALSSPLNQSERDERGWYLKMEDTRLKYGGAYTNVLSSLNFKNPEPRDYWVQALKKIKAETGLSAYLFDSFYNLGFMPLDYSGAQPTTQWRELLHAFKELQDAGIHFLIESFGPFGSPQHGCPPSYGLKENLFAAYKLTVALGYSTIPSGAGPEVVDEAEAIYRFFAHMTSPSFSLFQNKVRLDHIWTEKHKRALADYNSNRLFMCKRFLQEDGQGVLWHDAEGKRATLWNFAARSVALPGAVFDLTVQQVLAPANRYALEALHTYSITGSTLPVAAGE